MPQLDQDYVFLPQRLLADLRANPAAIGVYALLARLFLIYQEPIPLSAADLQRYDPALSYGAARGALQRLVALRWLSEQSGHKNHYLPTWGVVSGAALPWRMDAPTLGKPAHVVTLRLDRRLLDIGMGRLIPHPTYPAQTDNRYLERPIFSLRDVGAYAQALGGQVLAATPALWHYGLLRDGKAQPLHSAADLVARASQRILEGDGAALTVPGLRLLGLEHPGKQQGPSTGQLLFFVDHTLISDLIPPLIPDLIPLSEAIEKTFSAAESPATAPAEEERFMGGTPGIQSERSDPPPTPPAGPIGGSGNNLFSTNQDDHEEYRLRAAESQSETESARLLRSIGAFPSSIEELADLSAELIAQAIAYAESEPGIASVPGWVIEALRRHRDEGWPIPRPRTKRLAMIGDCPLDMSAYIGGAYGDLFRLGSDLSDLEGPAPSAPARQADLEQPSRAAPKQPARYTDIPGGLGGAQEQAGSPYTSAANATLTQELRTELLSQCGRRYRPLIAGLEVQAAPSTTVLICASVCDLGIVQNELLGAIHGILARLRVVMPVVCTTRAGWDTRQRRACIDLFAPPACDLYLPQSPEVEV
jgi:hypothetical protein